MTYSEGSAMSQNQDLSQDEIEQIEAERKERLDPDNRPDNAEVDNTDRTFEDGGFKD